MKVLMFVNMSLKKDKVSTGSWILALMDILREMKNIDFAFVTTSLDENEEFTIDNIKVTNIHKRKNILSKIKKKLSPSNYKKECLQKYLKVIDKYEPDIIHIHGFENDFAIISEFTDIPIVTTIQGIYSCIYLKYFSALQLSYIIKKYKYLVYVFKYGIFNVKNYKKKVDYEQLYSSKIKYYMGRTNFDKRVFSVLSLNSKYFHIPHILRRSFYENCWNPQSCKKNHLFTILDETPYKGLETILLVYNFLKANGINIIWTIAGISENSSIFKLFNKTFILNNFNDLKLIGLISEEEIVKNMKRSAIYIQASHIENSPNALSEALLMGMPCIASFAGGTSSFINDNEDGILFQDGDHYSLSGAILELMKNPKKAAEMGRKARERALLRHDKKRIIKQTTDTYKDILETEKKRSKI